MPNKPLQISVVTLFPDMFTAHFAHLPISRAVEKGLVQLNLVNLRDFAIDKRGTVDSPPYGGGPGMILRPEPIFAAINHCLKQWWSSPQSTNIIFLTPRGKTYTQTTALQLSTSTSLILVCGRYEGIDQRVVEYFTKHSNPTANVHAQEISIGNYVLSGGELAAMAIIESTIRLIPGAIDNPEALTNESFNPDQPAQLEHPQYSRPEEWQNMKVPQILLSGDHANIAKWQSTH